MGKLSKLKDAVDTALDMRKAARMERAKQMGFDVDNPVYHGTATDFSEFDPERSIGTQYWSTNDKAAIESGDVGAQGNGVIKELYHRVQNPAGWDEYDKFGIDELISRGYDGVKLPESDGTFSLIAFDPAQYRSVNAAFDPAKKDSANLLAGMGAAAVGLGAMAPEEAEAGVGGKMSQELLSRLQKFDPNLDAVVRESADGIRLDKLVVPKEGRNSGTGSQFMDELTSYADETGSPVALSADGDYGGSKAGQNRFYGRHGFVRNKGKNKNFSFTESMIREVADKYGVSLPIAGLIAGGAAPQEVQAAIHKESTLSNFATRRAAKKEYWGGLKEQVKGRGAGYRNPNAQQDMINAGLETMAAVNRGAADTVDFIGSQVPNAILNLMGSDKRVNSIYDVPGVNQATAGNYMDEGSDREAIRFAGEMLSPL